MTRIFRCSLRLACITALYGPVLLATGQAATATATINITATVPSFCIITAAPLAFGSYSVAAVDNATTTLSATCTVSTTYTVALDAGTGSGATTSVRVMTGTGGAAGSLLNYALYSDSGRTSIWGSTVAASVAGTGTGLTQVLTVYGQIPANQYVKPGSYGDTVTATLTY